MTSVGLVSVMAMVVVASVLAAMVKPGLQTIPAIVRSMSEQERLEVNLLENLERRDLGVRARWR